MKVTVKTFLFVSWRSELKRKDSAPDIRHYEVDDQVRKVDVKRAFDLNFKLHQNKRLGCRQQNHFPNILFQ